MQNSVNLIITASPEQRVVVYEKGGVGGILSSVGIDNNHTVHGGRWGVVQLVILRPYGWQEQY